MRLIVQRSLSFSFSDLSGENCQVRLKASATVGFFSHVPHLESSEWTCLLSQRSNFDHSGLLFPPGGIKEFGWEKNEMASAKRKSQLFKFKELPPYPTHLVEEMVNHIFISDCVVWKWLNSSTSLD